ncbi:MAG TPA: flippase activity-associated protein Agl23 [Thermomicrobiales bacterium]|nr:flippase activity-associated protein Agl23 [Thermomicrobiales bacterium]
MARDLPIGTNRAPRATSAAAQRDLASIAATPAPAALASPETATAEPAARAIAPAVAGAPRCAGRAFGARLTVETALYALLGLAALATRCYDLGSQALHHDESLHAYFSWLYYVGQGYHHDPLMHGPLLFHLTALAFFLFGAGDAAARYAPALFGAATVLLPWLLRRELGRWGALIASLMLLVSPSFLYFGRFERHDVYSAFFTLLFFCALVRYVREPVPRWALLGAAAWALLFTNKEDVFIVTAIFGAALAVALAWQVARRVLWLGAGFVAALALVAKVLPHRLGWPPLPAIPWATPTNEAVRNYVIAFATNPVVVAGLLLLAGCAIVAISLLDRQTGEAGWVEGLFGKGAPGTPVAAAHTLLTDRRTLGLCVGLAAAIYAVFYTSFFSNIPGLVSGTFGALGYWLGQQNVRRAEQPWFYYLLLLPQYDPLAALIGGWGVALTAWRLVAHRLWGRPEGPQPFVRGLLAWWAVASIAIYSWAGEKMPWMDIHLVLPLTLLAAALLGAAVERTLAGWRAARAAGLVGAPDGWLPGAESRAPSRDLVAGGAILAALVAWFLVGARLSTSEAAGSPWWPALAPLLAGVAVALGYGVVTTWGRAGRVALLAGAGALLLFHVHAGWALAYQHGDVPVDMLVYVQTSPDVTALMRTIDTLSAAQTGGKDLHIMYDSSTSWPFQWYLRDYANKQFIGDALTEPPPEDVALVLVGNDNLALHPEMAALLANYAPQQYPMRWHFPEDETYRPFAIAPELPVGRSAWQSATQPHGPLAVAASVLSSLTTTATQAPDQARLFRLLAYRQLDAPLGSYDFTVYVRKDLLPRYDAIRYHGSVSKQPVRPYM